jgi:hypothetical protein
LVSVVAPLTHAQAVSTVVTETTDFSNKLETPTVISPVLQVGTNYIRGSVDGHMFGTDHDYFRITLPGGSRLADLSVKVTGYSTTVPSSGFFDVLPDTAGNSGSVTIVGNSTQIVPFVIGDPANIILHAEAPFFVEPGATTYFAYEVQIVVEGIEVVAGTGIHKAVEITFPSESMVYYQLQCTSDLNSDNWINLGAPMQGNGGVMSAFDSTRGSDQRFYRVTKQ